MPRLSKIGAAALAAFGWTGLSSVTASYLQVAGGGGGGFIAGGNRGAGGGAGGYLTGTVSLNPTQSYTVVVGAGGTPLANGSNSQFGILTASVGGGAGGSQDGASSVVGQNGGSGGGGPSQSGTGSTAGGTGTAGQGNNGAAGSNVSGQPFGCGGGGGASAAGTLNNNPAGAGGAGSASSITGTSVTYAGGGGGGSYAGGGGAGGAGGAGGGGTGGGTNGNSTAGTANLGGGGGGADYAQTSGSNGGSGVVIISYPSPQQFGGGVVTVSGANTIHTFTTSGTLSPLSSLTASYLIVAGGGAGGGQIGGGGGAGGYQTGFGLTLDTNSIYSVIVGAGGTGTVDTGGNGVNSSFSLISTASVGGGGGGSSNANTAPTSGGSGGGSGGFSTLAGGAGTAGQGNAGGIGNFAGQGGAPNYPGGGGGGATGAGANSPSGTVPGSGGTGTASSITGTSVTYATGGTGGLYNITNRNGVAGTANTGNGGEGAYATAATGTVGGNGGSGVVIISYAGATQLMAGGTVTISGGNVIHTFNSSGYLTPLTLVGNSLRFRSSASAYLNRTPPVASNRTTWTWSGWVKKGRIGGGYQALFSAGTSSNTEITFHTDANTYGIDFGVYSGSYLGRKLTSNLYRDPAAWYHVVAVYDSTNATAANRMLLYVNGVQVTTFAVSTNPSQNTNSDVNNTVAHNLGNNPSASYYFDGYLTEVQLIDGQALTPNSFGTANQFGVWQPIRYGGSYGTNGFYLPFSNTASTTTLGLDFSPQNNNWTANNFSLARSTYTSYTSSSGTYTVPAGVTSLSYLVVAGGGGGGSGGGGAGGFLQGTMAVTGGQTIAYSIGAGGTGGNYGGSVAATNGSNTTFGALTAIGGGAGTFAGSNGTSGGSGSGGAGSGSGTTTGGAGTSGQGFAGGGNAGNTGSPYPSGGGGGAGAIGSNAASSTTSGAGGTGITWVNGTTYAGGGGGGTFSAGNPAGAGGAGGGGAGGSTANGTAGTANTGGGGGGSPSAYIGGAGGSGIIIIGTGSASTYDSMTDVPTLTSTTAANYCVLNPLDQGTSGNTNNGNISYNNTSTVVWNGVRASFIIPKTGEWYWEAYILATPMDVSIVAATANLNSTGYNDTYSYSYGALNGEYRYSGASQGSVATYTTGDTIAYYINTGVVRVYKNNNLIATWSQNLSAYSGDYFPAVFTNSTSANNGVAINFGQQPWKYTPPGSALALNTFNL